MSTIGGLLKFRLRKKRNTTRVYQIGTRFAKRCFFVSSNLLWKRCLYNYYITDFTLDRLFPTSIIIIIITNTVRRTSGTFLVEVRTLFDKTLYIC